MEESREKIDFSLILPVYNSESFLKETLKSISEIEYEDFEVIIINDGSTDSSRNICINYCEKLENFKFYENEKNIGLIETLNKGLLLANGKYIVRVDSDDLIHKLILQEYTKKIKEIQVTNFLLTSNSYYIKGQKILRPIFRYCVKSENIKKIILLENQINHPTACFPNYKKNNLFYGNESEVKYFEDCDLWIRMISNNYEVFKTDKVYLFYRVHKQSITKKYDTDKSVMKARYLNRSELIEHFTTEEISLIAGNSKDTNISIALFEKQIIKYIKQKGIDSDLKTWLLFYFLNLFKKNYKNLNNTQKFELVSIITVHAIKNLFNKNLYKHIGR